MSMALSRMLPDGVGLAKRKDAHGTPPGPGPRCRRGRRS